MKKYPITIHIGNYNGMRDQINGKGRLQLTVESFLNCVPELRNMDVRFIDNDSQDGSWEYIKSLPFGTKEQVSQIKVEPRWLLITVNNLANMRKSIETSDLPYFWNVENDTYFFRRNEGFIDRAIEILETNSDIGLVHMRRFTNIDEHDLPGIPRNLNRFSEIRVAPSGFSFYLMERRPEYALWIPTGINFTENQFDAEAGYGKCPKGIIQIGAVRERDGEFERLLTEHWNGYTSNGWIARRADLKFLIEEYNPLGERQMSMAFKKHFRAAKLTRDVFIEFGWKARTAADEEERRKTLESAADEEDSSVRYGKISPPYEGVYMDVPEDKLDIYS
ncbi:hypothetical protein A3K73_07990 [Candidatus Pacearchaeota archaeon RBG_13_36_9]|nr:MAG: hypothetical protein A3K73_07990 [Candidatus Pacearchaeota archaeon RBG_13_36_9]